MGVGVWKWGRWSPKCSMDQIKRAVEGIWWKPVEGSSMFEENHLRSILGYPLKMACSLADTDFWARFRWFDFHVIDIIWYNEHLYTGGTPKSSKVWPFWKWNLWFLGYHHFRTPPCCSSWLMFIPLTHRRDGAASGFALACESGCWGGVVATS